MKGHDDRGLNLVGKKRLKAEPPHAIDENAAVLSIAAAAPLLTAFGLEGIERPIKGQQGVGRWCEAPLAVAFHRRPLLEEIETERGGVALAVAQSLPVGDAEAETWDTLQALVRGGDNGIEGDLLGAQGQGAEGRHGIDQETPPASRHHLGHPLDRIEHAGGGFAVDHRDMSHVRLFLQLARDGIRVDRRILRPLQGGVA